MAEAAGNHFSSSTPYAWREILQSFQKTKMFEWIKWIFGRSSSSGCPQASNSGSEKWKLAELCDGPSSSASPQDYEAQQVNDSLDQLGKQPDVPTMQVLFFHGLPLEDVSNVHLATWDNGDGFIWPHAWLVQDFPGAQIFFVKYGAALENANFKMNNIGENLISDLLQANIGQVNNCPIVLVGHCIGGLVIKELCWKAHEELHSCDTLMNDRAKKLEAFLDMVRGIFYYSTPHHGIPEIPKGYRLRCNATFKYFEILSTDTSVLNSNFSKLCKRHPKWRIEGVGESLPVKSGDFRSVLVVPEASARDGVQIFNLLKEEDHFSVCKPKTTKSGGFYHLARLLGNISKEEIEPEEESRPENFQHVSKHVVGIHISLQEVKDKLKDVSQLGLTGMGGSGKTTLAKAAFNELGCEFEYTCFVPDVKFIAGTVESLKKEVWTHVYRNGKKVSGDMRWSQLSGKRLLLILDDISDVRDITVLSEIADGPSTESRFIATSRASDLFEHFYKVPFLDENNHGRELFMRYAFPNNETPSPKLRSLTEKIVKKCEGLPLTLEVLGQWLRRTKDEEVWKQTLNALDKAENVKNFNERLWAKLRPSIDGLEENEKNMFLDASTFFHGGPYDLTLREAQAAWREAYRVSEKVVWQTLVDRSLVYEVGEDEFIRVHEQLRSLGRKIANECNRNMDTRKLQDIKLLQSTNELDKQNIHALRIGTDEADGEDDHEWQSITDDGDSEQISFVDGKIHIASLALQELKGCRYLDIFKQDKIDGIAEVSSFPSRLVLLRCYGLKTLNLTHQSRLAFLEISDVESLPSSIGQLSALRIFRLYNTSLNSIPEKIGELSKLEVLHIVSCPCLQTLPERLGQLLKLKILSLSRCENLRTLPNSFGNLSALEHLQIYACGLETLPESFGNLPALNYLLFENCKDLKSLPESFGLLAALVDLSLIDCGLETLPESFGRLLALSRLEFEYCYRLHSLPKSFGNLPALNYLLFRFCKDLKSLPESFGLLAALVELKFERCFNLECLPTTFGYLSALRRLEFKLCHRLQTLPESFGKLSALNDLRFETNDEFLFYPERFGLLAAPPVNACYRLRSLPESFGKLPVLKHLKLSGCFVHLLESLGQLAKLEYLEIDNVRELKRLPDSLAELGSLRHLRIDQVFSLKSIPDYIQNLPSLHTLELGILPHVKELPLWLRETGVKSLGQSRKVFRIQDRHFSLTRDETDPDCKWTTDLVSCIHRRAMQKVFTSDYEGALAELEVSSLGLPTLDGFLLQQKGILKRMMGDLHGALDDLAAALNCFSMENDGQRYLYDCWRHKGYVNFLMGNIEGAENDGKMALMLQHVYGASDFFDSLGNEDIQYMHFRLISRHPWRSMRV